MDQSQLVGTWMNLGHSISNTVSMHHMTISVCKHNQLGEECEPKVNDGRALPGKQKAKTHGGNAANRCQLVRHQLEAFQCLEKNSLILHLHDNRIMDISQLFRRFLHRNGRGETLNL